ncbi:MAG: CPBP family glutamic-type intramembrane protease [Tessaracoccus sp.]
MLNSETRSPVISLPESAHHADLASRVEASALPVPGLPAEKPLPYHRLMRQNPRSARWWRPLTALAVTVGMYVVFALPMLVFAVFMELVGAPGWKPSATWTDPTNPTDYVLGLGLLALMIPAAMLGMRWGGGARGIVHSVTSRIRWGLLGRAAAFVVPIYALRTGGSFLLDPPADFAWPEVGTSLIAAYVIIIVLAPLQCAGEEYVFRALPMQMFGAWLRSPLWGILIPVPLFMLGHGYHWAGQIDIAVFAICAGALVWKSGGLELAIVMHTANNLTLFLVAPFSASSLQQGAVDPALLLISLPFTIGVTALLWVWISRRYGLRAFEPVTRASSLTARQGSHG